MKNFRRGSLLLPLHHADKEYVVEEVVDDSFVYLGK
jgi:hypothetical protein